MKHILILFILASTMLVSCHTSKNVEGTNGRPSQEASKSETTTLATAAECVKKANAQVPTSQCLTAKLKVELQGMGKELSVSGNLRMKRDDVVQIALSFLGIEVGRMEFTPQDVLIIDRMNKQYVRASYSEVSFLKKAELDFYSLQSLFWNEIFVPGKRSATSAADGFTLKSENGQNVLTIAHAPRLNYSFFTSTSANRLEKLEVKGSNTADKGTFSFTYSDFQAFGTSNFPHSMKMQVKGIDNKNTEASLGFNLSKLSTDSDWQTRTTVSSKYTRRSVDEVLGKLVKAGL